MATPRKPRPSFDVPAAKAPDAAGWAYRTDATAPTASTESAAATTSPPSAEDASVQASPSVLARVITTPFYLCALILLTPFSSFGRPSPPSR
jgi:hypothetical protein